LPASRPVRWQSGRFAYEVIHAGNTRGGAGWVRACARRPRWDGGDSPAAPAPTTIAPPLALPGPYTVACSNVAQDFGRVAPGENAKGYWEGSPAAPRASMTARNRRSWTEAPGRTGVVASRRLWVSLSGSRAAGTAREFRRGRISSERARRGPAWERAESTCRPLREPTGRARGARGRSPG